jgi:TonB-linked SusC/RagA family outer membrane protein
MNKYIVTLSGRYDGSSKFRKGQRFGFFPAGAVAWKLGSEKFIRKLDFINQLKLRVSYGSTGSQAISPLATRAKLTTGSSQSFPVDDGGNLNVGIGPSGNLANPDLSWETTSQFDIGADMAFLNSFLTFTVDYYNKKTTNMLLIVPLPDYTGVSNVTKNLGSMRNKGLEVALGLTPIQKKNLSFTANFNVSFNRNKVLTLGGRDKILTGPSTGAFGGVHALKLQVGEPLGTFRGYIFEGIYQKDQAQEAAAKGHQPGDAIYKDVNDDASINGNDITTAGTAQPDFLYGFNALLNFRNFDFNVLITGQYGGQIFNITRSALLGYSGGASLDPISTAILNRWTPDNPSNKIAGFTTTNNYRFLSSQFVQDATYLKIRNITLGYSIPPQLINKLSMSKLRIFASIKNAATFTKFTGFDPQMHQNGDNDVFNGLYALFPQYPLARIITFGINIKF